MTRYDDQKPEGANRSGGAQDPSNQARPGDASGKRPQSGDQGLRAPGASEQGRGQDDSDKVEAEKSDQLDAPDRDEPRSI